MNPTPYHTRCRRGLLFNYVLGNSCTILCVVLCTPCQVADAYQLLTMGPPKREAPLRTGLCWRVLLIHEVVFDDEMMIRGVMLYTWCFCCSFIGSPVVGLPKSNSKKNYVYSTTLVCCCG